MKQGPAFGTRGRQLRPVESQHCGVKFTEKKTCTSPGTRGIAVRQRARMWLFSTPHQLPLRRRVRKGMPSVRRGQVRWSLGTLSCMILLACACSCSKVARLDRACRGGNAKACFDLGARYEIGHGVVKNVARGAGLYRQACDGGSADGCFGRARLHLDGQLVGWIDVEGASAAVQKAVAIGGQAAVASQRRACDGPNPVSPIRSESANGCFNRAITGSCV